MDSQWYMQLMAGEVAVFEKELTRVVGAIGWMDEECCGLLREVFAVLAGWLEDVSFDVTSMGLGLVQLARRAELAGDELLWQAFLQSSQWVLGMMDGNYTMTLALSDEVTGLVNCVLGLVGNGQVPGSSRQ